MAEAVVAFLLGKLNELLTQEASLLVGVGSQVRALERDLRRIQCFLRDADGKYRESESVRNWVKDITHVAYDAEDVIDTYILEIKRKQRGTLVGFLRRFASLNQELVTRHTLGKQIEDIKSRIREISESRSTFGIEIFKGGEGTSTAGSDRLRDRRRTSDWEDETNVVGVRDDVKTLVGRVTEGEARRTVVSIVGMGGLGKTTLAKKVYNSGNVKSHFHCRAWIYVSQECRVKEVFEGLAKQLMGVQKEEMENMDVEELKKKLCVYLKAKRYLIVIDDIWKREAWDGLKAAFPDAQNRSRILLTTRKIDVARYSDTRSTPHELRFLKEDESWELFLQQLFPLNSDLEGFGRGIVAKCGGLPLAIVVIAGLLSIKEKTPDVWKKVMMRLNWELGEGEDQIKSILALSYDDLPYHLKSCFLYFGLFPEDLEIQTEKLIKMWVAEGFVQQRGEETMEEVADDYLDELISRSMIQVAGRSRNGQVKACRIHDLLHDLAIRESNEGNFCQIYQNQDLLSPISARRLAIHNNYVSSEHSSPHLRSILAINIKVVLPQNVCRSLLVGCKLLKVLDLKGLYIPRLPCEIGDLTHLRYLGLRHTGIVSLPVSIRNLWNLQTLDIRDTYITSLPKGFWKIKHLRHVLLPCDGGIMPEHVGKDYLKNLQTLEYAHASRWVKDCLGNLTNIRHLSIEGVSSSHREGLCDSIAKLHLLTFLSLQSEFGIPKLKLSHFPLLWKLQLIGPLEKLPEWHEFPPNLAELDLFGSKLLQDPLLTLDKLPKLHYLRIARNAYLGKEMGFTATGFPLLEVLNLGYLHELEKCRFEEGVMPRLKCITFSSCPNMKMSPEGLDHLTSLQDLWTSNMLDEFNSRLREKEGLVQFKIDIH